MLHNLLIPSSQTPLGKKKTQNTPPQTHYWFEFKQVSYLLRGHTTDRDLERDLDLDLEKNKKNSESSTTTTWFTQLR